MIGAAKAERIVRALAASNPVDYVEWLQKHKSSGLWCALCHATMGEHETGWTGAGMPLARHEPECPWRQACEFVAAEKGGAS
jgi:hypothetical protein